MSGHTSDLDYDNTGRFYLWCDGCSGYVLLCGRDERPSVEQLSEAWDGHLKDNGVPTMAERAVREWIASGAGADQWMTVDQAREHSETLEFDAEARGYSRGHAAGVVAALAAILADADRGTEEQEVWLHSATGWLSGEVPVDVASTSPQRAVTAALRHCEAAFRGQHPDALDAAISERARSVRFGDNLAERGITTIALDEHGRLTRYHPDGTTSHIDAPPDQEADQ